MNASDYLLYGGIALMVIALVLFLVCLVVFLQGGKRIREVLEREYGQPWRYNL